MDRTTERGLRTCHQTCFSLVLEDRGGKKRGKEGKGNFLGMEGGEG